MRKMLLVCMQEFALAEKALARITQIVYYKSSRKDFTPEEWSEFNDHYMQLGLLEYTLNKLRLELSGWLGEKHFDEETEKDANTGIFKKKV